MGCLSLEHIKTPTLKVLHSNSATIEKSSAGLYRYGFNGMEREDEHTQGKYDFGARIYDSRLGRWLAVDGLFMKYPTISPFVFTVNNPIFFVDIDGNKFVTFNKADRKALRRFKKELKLTSAGRIVLKKLKKSERSVLIRFTPAIMQPVDDQNRPSGGVTEGLTFPARVNKENGGLSPIPEGTTANPETEMDVTVVKVSDGAFEFRNYYRTMTGKELSDADPTSESDVKEKNRLMQEFLSCAGYSVEDQYGRGLDPSQVTEQTVVDKEKMLFPYGGNKKLMEASQALPNETHSEQTGRVGTHEGEHVVTFDRLDAMRQTEGPHRGEAKKGMEAAFDQLEGNRELPSYKVQAKVVKEQKVQRTQK